MMKSKVYVETTVISYLAASPSRDIVVAAHQQLTKAWWDQRARFELFVSQAVVDEASRGDASVAKRRLVLLDTVPVLGLSDDVHEFAKRLLAAGAVPAKAALDGLHIGVAALNRMESCSLGIVRISRTPRSVARSRRRAETPACGHRSFARRKN